MIRVGIGYDVHRLVEERPLILGGVKIKHLLGLQGHSDADVLVHAIIDALLGALALGDIGKHFPDTEGAYKDCDSLLLLKKVGQLVAEKGYRVNNIDSTIIAQAPSWRPILKSWWKILEEPWIYLGIVSVSKPRPKKVWALPEVNRGSLPTQW